jgi:hypothetical protein
MSCVVTLIPLVGLTQQELSQPERVNGCSTQTPKLLAELKVTLSFDDDRSNRSRCAGLIVR